MMGARGQFVRQVLLLAMIGALASPLPWTLLVNHGPARVSTLRSAPLIDQGKPLLRPSWSPSSWWDGEFQQGFEPWFASVLEPRGWVIRRVNQVYYSLFHRSYMLDGQIVVGREHQLYGLDYVRAHCEGERPAPPPHRIEQLERFSRALAARNGALIFVVSPSKAEAMPEYLPAGGCARRSGERPASRWVSALRGRGVAVIDGPELVSAMAREDPLPPFPRGGVHWSSLAATRIAAIAVDEARRRSAVDLGGMELDHVRWDATPVDTDTDLASMLNLRFPPFDYPVGKAEVVCRATSESRRTALIGIGGSFLGGLVEPIAACGIFRSVEHYFYYDLGHRLFPAEYAPVERRRIDWRAIVESAPVLLVEVNESILGDPVTHLEKFLDDVAESSQMSQRQSVLGALSG